METLRLALDWTPNTNHLGFLLGRSLGFYNERNLSVEILSPEEDDYAITPAKKVSLGDADIGIGPSESVISFGCQNKYPSLVAIAPILQFDASSICVKETSSIFRPRDLDGKTYASYQARYEDHLVRQMIINDGGRGEIQTHYPKKLGIWNQLKEEKTDATWIFRPWEGVEAELANYKLRHFVLEDYNLPYGYSPVLFVRNDRFASKEKSWQKFLEASQKAFLLGKNEPENSSRLFVEATDHPSCQDTNFITQSLRVLNSYAFDAEGNWGSMKQEKWSAFINTLLSLSSLPDEEKEQLKSFSIEKHVKEIL